MQTFYHTTFQNHIFETASHVEFKNSVLDETVKIPEFSLLICDYLTDYLCSFHFYIYSYIFSAHSYIQMFTLQIEF